MTMTDATPRLLSIAEATDQLRVSRSLVFDLMTSGQLPSVRVASRRYIRADDLTAFVRSCRVRRAA